MARLGKLLVVPELLFDDAPRRIEGMDEGQRLAFRHDAAVAVAAAIFEDDDVAGPRVFFRRFGAAVEDETEITLLASMQMPIRRIGPRVERRAKAGIDEDAHDQHAAID